MESSPKQPLEKRHFDKQTSRKAVKHGILKSYVDGWTPILLHSGYEDLVIVDGFAGKGKFGSTNDVSNNPSDDYGSPLVILDALYNHPILKQKRGSVTLVCIEANKENFDALTVELKEFKKKKPADLKTEVDIILYNGDFNDIIVEKVLPNYKQYPMFVFADPFGYGAIKMSTFENILATHSPSSPKELLINFMDSYLKRFERAPLTKQAQDDLFGDSDWRDHLDVTRPAEKLEVFCNIFIEKLHNAYRNNHSKFSLKFGIRGGQNDHVYHLIFVSNHGKGHETMKSAMNRYSQSSAYFVYSEWVNKQEIVRNLILEKGTNANDVLHQILETFRGKTVFGEAIWGMISENDVHVNFIVFLKSALKKYALNKERSFSNIEYSFPTDVEKEIEALLPETPRKGEKYAKIEDIVVQIANRFSGESNVTGLEVLKFAKTKYEAVDKKTGELKTELKERKYLKQNAARFNSCVFEFPGTTARKKLNFDKS